MSLSVTSNSLGTKRFTPKLFSVFCFVSCIRLARSPGARLPAAIIPSPPAFDTSETSSGVVMPPAIGACMMAQSIPSSSVILFESIVIPPVNMYPRPLVRPLPSIICLIHMNG